MCVCLIDCDQSSDPNDTRERGEFTAGVAGQLQSPDHRETRSNYGCKSNSCESHVYLV